jgi:gamma-glutamyltranspeptidase/glutathione hydrolase
MVCLLAPPARDQALLPPPEPAGGGADRALAVAATHMVATANPHATEAGLEILRAGGSAVDAAVAVALVLNLVEPQSSGIGGGGFLVHWDAARKDVKTYDGRETAPSAAEPGRFLREGEPIPFDEAVFSGLSVGVPGLVHLMELAHQRHGRLPWARLFEPAIRLADQGFRVSPRLNLMLRLQGAARFAPAARSYFFDAVGSERPVGHVLRNPEFAATLKAIAEGGAGAFYQGPIAEAIVRAVAAAPNHAGDITLADLAGYRAKERAAICTTYRTRRICGMGPPSSGGITVAMTLELLEPFDIGSGPQEAMRTSALHIIAEAEKLAYADRNRYIADPDFVAVPAGLLDEHYLAARRRMIDPNSAMARAEAGLPPGVIRRAFGDDATLENAGTTHFSIVDRDGNAVAMTATIEQAFGARIWAAGFLLNNELTDFAFRPGDQRTGPVANAVAPMKRPRSSMAPTLVFGADGEFEAALGSVGGSAIIYYVVKALIALIDWQLDPQAAAALISFGSRGTAFEIEADYATVWYALNLRPLGHRIALTLPVSGTHIIRRRGGMLEGGADPRREGLAKGD